MKGNDPVATYFDQLPESHKRQFEERASGANFNLNGTQGAPVFGGVCECTLILEELAQ